MKTQVETPMNFWSMGREYLHAGQVLIAADPQASLGCAPRATLLLVCHGIELTLKAYLLSSGVSIKDVTIMRHDLAKILDEAEARGLRHLGRDDRKVLKWMNQYYSKKGFEYVTVRGMTLPRVRTLERVLVKLVSRLREPCMAATSIERRNGR